MTNPNQRCFDALAELKHPVAEIEILDALRAFDSIPEPVVVVKRRLGIGCFAEREPALSELALDDDYLAENDN